MLKLKHTAALLCLLAIFCQPAWAGKDSLPKHAEPAKRQLAYMAPSATMRFSSWQNLPGGLQWRLNQGNRQLELRWPLSSGWQEIIETGYITTCDLQDMTKMRIAQIAHWAEDCYRQLNSWPRLTPAAGEIYKILVDKTPTALYQRTEGHLKTVSDR